MHFYHFGWGGSSTPDWVGYGERGSVILVLGPTFFRRLEYEFGQHRTFVFNCVPLFIQSLIFWKPEWFARVGPKNFPTCFCQNFIKFLPNLIIFGLEMVKTIELCKVHLFSTSPNLCQCTTVLKTDAPNCCILLSCCARKSSNDLTKHTINELKCIYLAEL